MDREVDLAAFVDGSCWLRSEQHEAGLREIDAGHWSVTDSPIAKVPPVPMAAPLEIENRGVIATAEVPEASTEAESSMKAPRPASGATDGCSTLISDLHDVTSLQHQIDTQLAAELRQDGTASGPLQDSAELPQVKEDGQAVQRSNVAEKKLDLQTELADAVETLQAHHNGVPTTAVHPSPTAVSDDGPEAFQHDSPRPLSSTRSSPDPLQGPPTKLAKLDGSRRRPGSSAHDGVANNRKPMMAPPIPPLTRALEIAHSPDPGRANTAHASQAAQAQSLPSETATASSNQRSSPKPALQQGHTEGPGAIEVDDRSLAGLTSAGLRPKVPDSHPEMTNNSSGIATATGIGRDNAVVAKKPKSISRELQALASTSVGTKISPKLRTRTQTKAVAQSKPSGAARRRHSGK
ncbi:hypothetical protein LTR53_004342 [Teratosphaeriaceae sp. CCFEE 6253]|nr:hypothetical protein LTR53_004342 [Teratosphaeriaceae sp. CCFEE 6253]